MKYRHFIWDFDGTLFDTYPVMAKGMQLALAQCGHAVETHAILGYMKDSMGAWMHHVARAYGDADAILQVYRAWMKSVGTADIMPFPGVREVCEKVVRHGGTNHLLTHRGTSAIAILETWGMRPLFTELITKNSGFARKPSPDGILHIMGTHRLQPGETLMVGDRDIDLLAGKNAGIDACYFRESGAPELDMADITISDFHVLGKWVKD